MSELHPADDGDPHYIPSNVITLPNKQPTAQNKGRQAGEAAAYDGIPYLTAYSLAVADSVQYMNPMVYVRAFQEAYREREAKLIAWG